MVRADARRNIAAILDAAVVCLTGNPDASLGDIAQAAGVGRVTLYGHFKSRAELLDAVLTRTMAEADAVLDAVDTAGEPAVALTRLVEASWQIVHRFRSVYQAAGRELPPERFHGSHDRVRRRIQTIIERGRRAGVFRTDVPAKWLTAAAVGLMHAAAEESAAGRLTDHDAAVFIPATVLAALTAPGAPVPVVPR
ncbi:TetR/AcrR family transcriptional regulator [Dactylosporangium sp. NPDC049140]|uniref:TetR/AcrR family transcriptional regulator n=1 Tax=Dactylosporangium sp. NPDC049140 TaxID=3155647 RepID=UPI0033D84B60